MLLSQKVANFPQMGVGGKFSSVKPSSFFLKVFHRLRSLKSSPSHSLSAFKMVSSTSERLPLSVDDAVLGKR